MTTTRWEFFNDKFQKGEKEKLCEIRRRKPWMTNKQQKHLSETSLGHRELDHNEDQRSSSSNSSTYSDHYNTLMDENKRLKNENEALSSELASRKSKCKKLLDLVAKYGNTSKKLEEEDERPKLFGVRLEVEGEGEMKRKKAEDMSQKAFFLLSQSCK